MLLITFHNRTAYDAYVRQVAAHVRDTGCGECRRLLVKLCESQTILLSRQIGATALLHLTDMLKIGTRTLERAAKLPPVLAPLAARAIARNFEDTDYRRDSARLADSEFLFAHEYDVHEVTAIGHV